MIKTRIYKIVFVITFVLLLISLFFNYQQYEDEKRKDYNYGIFLNQYYTDLGQAIDTTNGLLEEGTTVVSISEKIISLGRILNRIDHELADSAIYLDGVEAQGITFYSMAAQTIMSGTTVNGHKIPAFMSDQSLTQQELAFLEGLNEQLKAIEDRLQSDEPTEEKVNLSKKQFNEKVMSLSTEDYYSLVKAFQKKD